MDSLFFLFFLLVVCRGETILQWNYLKGSLDDNPPSPNVLGNAGQESPTFHPSSRGGSASWVDTNNNLWLYGGLGDGGDLADLWMLDTATNNWAFVAGTANTVNMLGDFNTFPSSSSNPASFTDNMGFLYYFGGEEDSQAGNLIDELWQWDVANQAFTFLSGSGMVNSAPHYGTLGVTNGFKNFPGARRSSAGWVQLNNNCEFWIFGGFGIDTNDQTGVLNDLWFFDNCAGTWTWMSGSKVINTATTATTPGGRQGMAYWQNAAGNLFIYGGQDSGGNTLNELWMWNVATNTWSFFPNSMGPTVYNAVARADKNNNVWLFGGNKDATTYQHDLWLFNGNVWTLVVGDTLTNTPSVANSSNIILNIPGGRSGNTLWITPTALWIYGGHGYGLTQAVNLADLWTLTNATYFPNTAGATTVAANTTTLITTTTTTEIIPTEGIIVAGVCLLIPYLIVVIIAAAMDMSWHKKATNGYYTDIEVSR